MREYDKGCYIIAKDDVVDITMDYSNDGSRLYSVTTNGFFHSISQGVTLTGIEYGAIKMNIEDLEKRLEETRSNLKDARDKNVKLDLERGEHLKEIAALKKVAKTTEATYEAQIANLGDDNERLRSRIKSYERQVSHNIDTISPLEHALDRKEEIQNLRNRLNDSVINAVNGAVNSDAFCEMVEEADPVNHPSHYKFNGVEVIELVGPNVPHLANAVKYICRSGKKDDEVEDLRKAEWYIKRMLEEMDKNQRGEEMLYAIEIHFFGNEEVLYKKYQTVAAQLPFFKGKALMGIAEVLIIDEDDNSRFEDLHNVLDAIDIQIKILEG